jgi:hypothetical protein
MGRTRSIGRGPIPPSPAGLLCAVLGSVKGSLRPPTAALDPPPSGVDYGSYRGMEEE